MLKKLLWNCVIGIAHLIPAKTYKNEALEYLRYRRDRPKRPDGPKAIPTEPPEVIPPTQRLRNTEGPFIDHGPRSNR